MAAIDLVVLGILKQQPLSAYEMQKLVEYRHISKWVKISTPSIYKKVIQLEEKGMLRSAAVREGNMPEKAVYSLTESGEREFERLMEEISLRPVRLFLDINAVLVNLDGLPPQGRERCLDNLSRGVRTLRAYLEDELPQKEQDPDVPRMGLAVLRQQLALAEAIENWLASLEEPVSPAAEPPGSGPSSSGSGS